MIPAWKQPIKSGLEDMEGMGIVCEHTRLMQQVVEQHAHLVRKIAHHMALRLPASVCVDDLIQAGMLGLLEASQHYDGNKGASFDTYAGIRIRGAMLDEIRKGDWVPRSVHRNSRMIEKAIQQLEQRCSAPTDREVAGWLGVELGVYQAMLRDIASGKIVCLDDLGVPADDVCCADACGQDEPWDHAAQQAFLDAFEQAVRTLPEREKKVLQLYYGDDHNFKAIGQLMGVTQSRICQMHAQAVRRLKAQLQRWIRDDDPSCWVCSSTATSAAP